MWSLRKAFVSIVPLLASPVANAADAETFYSNGEYAAAIDAGEAQGGSDGYAVAARAALADAELREMPCLECLGRAAGFAEDAIRLDSRRAEAYIYLVVALGRRARLIGFFQAQREGLGGRTNDAIDAALEVDPDYPWALAARGGWHIEVVRLAGRILGGFLFGASIDQGIDQFRRAMEAEPENLVIPYQFALSLSAYDINGRRGDVRAALSRARMLTPRDAYERAIQMRAGMLLDALNAESYAEFRTLLDLYRGNP
jgi:hypothetical protein